MILPPIQNTVRFCKQMTLLILYYGNYKLITPHKFIDSSVQFSNIPDLSVCFKSINFAFHILPEMTNRFMSLHSSDYLQYIQSPACSRRSSASQLLRMSELSIHMRNSLCWYEGVWLKYKFQHNGTWLAVTWLPHHLFYHLGVFLPSSSHGALVPQGKCLHVSKMLFFFNCTILKLCHSKLHKLGSVCTLAWVL